MRVGICGATGAVGRALLVHLLTSNVLSCEDEIVLVSRGSESNHSRLLAIATDLSDGFDLQGVKLSICWDLESLAALDVFVMTAGATIGRQITQRPQLASANFQLFRDVAKALSSRCPDAFFLIISNPVELAVEVFCEHLHQRRVVGMGAEQDSLRFERAIAAALNIPRASIRASVVGEHGRRMVPLWSSVFLVDGTPEMKERLESLKHSTLQAGREEALQQLNDRITAVIVQARYAEAASMLKEAPPDLRILVEPLLTAKLLHSTPNATANATLRCLAAIRHGDGRFVHGQVSLTGEFYNLEGVLGVPLTLQRSGWDIAAHTPLTDLELARVKEVALGISEEYSAILSSRSH